MFDRYGSCAGTYVLYTADNKDRNDDSQYRNVVNVVDE